jgi:hypothetical protein
MPATVRAFLHQYETMTFALRTFTAGFTARNYVDHDAVTTCAATLLFRVDASKADPVNVDINQGSADLTLTAAAGPQGSIGTARTVVGTVRTSTVGRDVVVNVHASHAGTLVIEDSADGGSTWLNATSFPVVAGSVTGVRFAPGTTRYRCSFIAEAGKSLSQVHVTSQLRDVGV